MRDKKIFNFLEFIKALKKGEVCLNEFANKFDLSLRSVQRYKNDLENFFDIKLLLTKKGCYTFLGSDIEKVLLNKNDLNEFKKLAYILSLINPKMLKFLKIDEKIIKKFVNNDIFLIKESPVEELENIDLEILQKAIKIKDYVDIKYISNKKYFFENVKPLKIIFAEGNWYLAVLTNDEVNNGFKFLRLNWIKGVKRKNKAFKVPMEAKEFLENFQTLFSKYKEKFFEVIVEVDKEVARYFRVKKFLPSQEILNDDENLKIRYVVNNEDEILLLAKRWLPYMKIISPISLDEKLQNILKKYLKK
jgi:predicted DNA-binding transcriptional regulator YafY